MSGSIVAAIQRKYIRRFKNANAFELKTAKSLDELGLKDKFIFQGLVSRGVFREAPDQKYYIDKETLELFEARRRKIMIAVLFVSLLILIWGIFFAK